ncbi:glycosyltransferase family A protein [Mucilaginibacter sp. L3T2-6]|uniref:glycosyltransferase family 2 protein n=1 Tax=Mucilaginibacter sp. L3T2-6 TaxID=3062491 RepID=UPI002675B41C|nr:glycosyltransferase family A protein [Mucilaginibacter sp. L3T2-6]MDO3642234.1 glycosyltransferase family A protein [Mucilaginibacter sp. L3T2-6]MDV6214729.1 glycosyltransferase family A protein [Mucilaginibacter sp. L3T2-6]
MPKVKIKPKVSIVIPVYNGSRYLQQTVVSVLKQSFNDFEVLILNDGSTDNTGQIVLELENLDNRIRAFEKENTGVAATRNLGLERALGEFVVFLDADDLLGEDFIQSRVEALMTNSQAGACGSKISFIDEKGVSINQSAPMQAPGDKMMEDILFYNSNIATIPSNLMFRKQVLIDNSISFDTRLHSSADRLFLCKLALVSTCISLSCQNIFYRVHSGSMYHNPDSMKKLFKDNELFVNILINEYIVPKRLMKEFLRKNYYMLSGAAIQARDYLSFFWYVIKYGLARVGI